MNMGVIEAVIAAIVIMGAVIAACYTLVRINPNSVWHDRKRPIFGLPLSFTVYDLTNENLFIQSGMLNLKEEDIRLYRIMDITYKASFWQRIFGVGTISLKTSDASAGNIDIVSVKKAKDVKERLSQAVERERDRKRVMTREIVTDDSPYN